MVAAVTVYLHVVPAASTSPRLEVLVAPAGSRLEADQAARIRAEHLEGEAGMCTGCASWWGTVVRWPCRPVRWARPELQREVPLFLRPVTGR